MIDEKESGSTSPWSQEPVWVSNLSSCGHALMSWKVTLLTSLFAWMLLIVEFSRVDIDQTANHHLANNSGVVFKPWMVPRKDEERVGTIWRGGPWMTVMEMDIRILPNKLRILQWCWTLMHSGTVSGAGCCYCCCEEEKVQQSENKTVPFCALSD